MHGRATFKKTWSRLLYTCEKGCGSSQAWAKWTRTLCKVDHLAIVMLKVDWKVASPVRMREALCTTLF